MTRLLAVYHRPSPCKMVQGGNTYYLAYDQVGSLRAVLNTSGAFLHEITYDSFGNVISETNSGLTIPLGFAGGLHDRGTGLVRFGYRDYDPDTGRWTAKDRIGFMGGDTNLYTYCRHDAVNRVDPVGLFGYYPGHANDVAGAQALVGSGVNWWVQNADVPGPYGSPDPREWSSSFDPRTWNNIMDGPQDGTLWGGVQNASVVVAAGAAIVAGGAVAAEVAGVKTVLGVHVAHHTFRILSRGYRLAHIQLNYFMKGVKGSGGTLLRIPIPSIAQRVLRSLGRAADFRLWGGLALAYPDNGEVFGEVGKIETQ